MPSLSDLPLSIPDRSGSPTHYVTKLEWVVLTVTVLALTVRLVGLGTRVAHQDEARVAYWAYRFMETGAYEYRPIVHGPFLTIVTGHLFGLFGASDFTMRLPVAVIGGLLPLTALLFRYRLRDSETVALSILLAANPLLLYYSRFYRNDVLLAGFMLVAFGCFVRAYDDQRPAFLYAGTGALALAFTTKENALVYLVAWAGATILIWDHRLFIDRPTAHTVATESWTRIIQASHKFRQWVTHGILAILGFFAIVVFFYAPRNPDKISIPHPPNTYVDTNVPGLYEAFRNPSVLPSLIEHATVGTWNDFLRQWGSGNEASYLSAFTELTTIIEAGAAILLIFAILGVIVDRYSGVRPNDVVSFSAYWGFASILGYPVIVDNPFPWETIHMIVPLAIPAAVGVAFVGRRGMQSVANGDLGSTTVAVLVVLLVIGQVGVTAIDSAYINAQESDNELVQYAQPATDMQPLLAGIDRIVQSNDGTDVLFYGDDRSFDGDEFYAPNPATHSTPPPGDGWFERLPFAWYLESYGAETESIRRAERLNQRSEKPPIVFAFGDSEACSRAYDNHTDIDQYLESYRRYNVDRFQYDGGCTISSVSIYVDQQVANNHSLAKENLN